MSGHMWVIARADASGCRRVVLEIHGWERAKLWSPLPVEVGLQRFDGKCCRLPAVFAVSQGANRRDGRPGPGRYTKSEPALIYVLGPCGQPPRPSPFCPPWLR